MNLAVLQIPAQNCFLFIKFNIILHLLDIYKTLKIRSVF